MNILIAGPSGSGKSTMTAGVIERLMERTYQLCIVDPEGDYGTLPEVFTIGNQHHAVTVTEVLAFLEDTKVNINVNLLGIPLADRPLFFAQLLPNLQAMRTRTGRPHWIVLDEAHHMVPAEWSHLDKLLPHKLGETVLVTVHPDHLAPLILVTGRYRDRGRAFAARHLETSRRRDRPDTGVARGVVIPEGKGRRLVPASR